MSLSDGFRSARRQTLATLFLALAASAALAQTPPDAGRILQETRPLLDRPVNPPAATILVPTPPSAPTAAAGDDVRVLVSEFDFSGNSVLSTEALRAVVARWVGRPLSFGELVQAVEAVEARYKQDGYFLAQANLAPQKIHDGVIEISLSEGRLGETRLEGESRVAPDVLYRYLDRLPPGAVLTLSRLERQVLFISDLAGGHINVDLQAGDKPGSTDLVLVQQLDEPLSARLEANNHGSPSTGGHRLGLSMNANSPFKQGERISLNALGSDGGGLLTYSLRGELPLGGDGLRVSSAASRATYSLGGAFTSLNASGTADTLRVGAAYPLLRGRSRNLKLLAELDQSRLVDQFRTAGVELDKRSHGLTLTASADWLDTPPTGPGAAGSFGKAMLNASRQQTLSPDLSLQLQVTAQAASKNLDSSEKLSLGGPQSLPGYAGGDASADSGAHLKLALRWQALGPLALTAFADHARLTLAHAPLATAASNHRRLADVGLSADWSINAAANASLILARPLTPAADPAASDKARLWLNVGYNW
jgi:hemolysin activation/secretion protein